MPAGAVAKEAYQISERRSGRLVGLASAAGAAMMGGANKGLAATITDADILNFALNLEYLEAEFYTVATTGKTIDKFGIGIDGTGMTGMTTGGKQVTLQNNLVFTYDIALQIADDERAHVKLIRGALEAHGVTPVAKPAINLNALGIGFGSQTEFLTSRALFEDVGVSAYGGAAPLIQDKAILGYAARILAAEAEHVGNIRLQVARLRVPTGKLDGVNILPPPTDTEYLSLDSNGLSAVRSPGQVPIHRLWVQGACDIRRLLPEQRKRRAQHFLSKRVGSFRFML
jgi:hypothetical protein